MPGSSFEEYWETQRYHVPSDTAAAFLKPMLKDAFNVGRALGRKEDASGGKRVTKNSKISGGDIIVSGRSGASSANE